MDAFALGVGFERGEVAAFTADFALGGFSGPGAGAILGREVNTLLGWGPVRRFFHRVIVVHDAIGGCRVFTPWRADCPSGILSLMQMNENLSSGPGAGTEVIRRNEPEEPLFGDPRWIDERMQALHAESEEEA